MPNPIKPRRSHTAGAIPTTSDLEANELGINWTDGKFFTKHPTTGNIVSIVAGGGGGGGEDTLLRSLFVPPAPTSVTAAAGSAQATVSWTAPTVLAQTPITDYVVQYSSNGGTTWTTFTPGATVSSPLTFSGVRPSSLSSGTTANGYTLSGSGTSGSPAILRIGGGNQNDYRVWLLVNQTGTLNWTVTASSEADYDGGRLYTHSGPANYVAQGYAESPQFGYTAVSNWVSGVQTQTGTTSVTTGQQIVLQWTRDDGGDSGNNRIELSAYIS